MPRPAPHPSRQAGEPIDRRRFVLGALAALAAGGSAPRGLLAMAGRGPKPHPEPRAGITGDRVLRPDQLEKKRRDAVRAYDIAREIPEVLDGLHCYCECDESMGHRSLLSCFESQQAAGCIACQEQALLAQKLHQQGKTLDEIRQATDREYA